MRIKNGLDIWSGGQLLAFSGIDGASDFENGITARSSFNGIAIDIKLPDECRIEFPPPDKVRLAGDFFELSLPDGRIVKGAFSDAHHILIQGPCLIEAVPARLESAKDGNKTLIGVKSHFKPDLLATDIDKLIGLRSKWLESIKIPGRFSEKRNKALLKALSQLKTQVYSPEGIFKGHWTTPDRWPHRRLWLWDSVFHAIGLRHLDINLAREAINSVFDAQGADGLIPLMADPFEKLEITQPPLLALGVSLLNETEHSKTWLESLYPKLKAYLKWDMLNRDKDGAGLLEWLIGKDPKCRSGESGADNSPRFDSAHNLDAIDFNAFLSHECELMAAFANTLGLADEEEEWLAHHRRLNSLMNERLWSEKNGLYMDYDNDLGIQTEVLSYAGFLPLICGAPSEAQAEKIVKHLKNPGTFGTPFGIATVARSCALDYSKDMWRGPVWINVNWLVARGLRRYGFEKEAENLTSKTLAVIEEMYSKYGVFFEFYDDRLELDPPKLMRKGKNAPEISPFHQPFSDYGWTATLYIDMCLSKEKCR
ncbi:MAG: hypothetical protein A2X49_09560 [Lentisphaerae bacterium GWF2_52_8]|nr:MAG: hypothetical protein A2X49_09560 [Lentisphaerae bacterium GWF2_52_8]